MHALRQARNSLLITSLAIVCGIVYFYLQQWLMESVFAALKHPLGILTVFGNPLLGLYVWNLGETLFAGLLAGIGPALLIARLASAHPWLEAVGGAAAATTLHFLYFLTGVYQPFPLWYGVTQGIVLLLILPLLTALFTPPVNPRHG